MKHHSSTMTKCLATLCLSLSAVVLLTALASCAVPQRDTTLPANPAGKSVKGPPAIAFNTLKTFSASGKGGDVLQAGKETELLSHTGHGCLTYMFFAMDERVRVRVYVDGEAHPSIDMALDLGHGYAFGGSPAPFGSPKMGRYGAQFNTYRIPYGSSVRVTLFPMTNVFDAGTGKKGWWTIRGTDNLPAIVGGMRLPDNARLRLYTLEPYDAKPLEEFNMCDVQGAGMLYLVVIAAQSQRKVTGSWTDLSYMEGDIRAYIDGAKVPEFLSSGLEDYFLGSGYFHQNQLYYGAVAGLTYINKAEGAFSAYRFHDDDPVFFQHGFRLTCRDGETYQQTSNGWKIGDPPPTEYRTYVWLYRW